MNGCVQQRVPVVGIDRQLTVLGVDHVCSNNAAGIELVADQPLCNDCWRSGWLDHSPSTWAGHTCGEAFSRAP